MSGWRQVDSKRDMATRKCLIKGKILIKFKILIDVLKMEDQLGTPDVVITRSEKTALIVYLTSC